MNSNKLDRSQSLGVSEEAKVSLGSKGSMIILEGEPGKAGLANRTHSVIYSKY